MRPVKILTGFAVLIAVGCTTLPERAAYEDRRLIALTSPALERFKSDADFLNYVRAVRQIARARGLWWAHGDGPEYAQAQEVPCPEGVQPPCYSDAKGEEERVVVTGSRISAPAVSITNVQMRGVDEGDIVKQFGRFLIVLQDGRLFSVTTRPNGRPGLALVDRANVYRQNTEDTWYDEMLIHENRIVVTGYSYDHQSAEYSVFTIDEAGSFAREATYYISADDYYSSENYATRLVDGNLVIRTAVDLNNVNPDQPMKWPVVRRWQREGRDDAALSTGVRAFDARDIYRPLQPTLEPAIHTISVCNLGTPRSGDELDCKTTALVAPQSYSYFVSPAHAYLWLSPGFDERGDLETGPACDPQHSTDFATGVPAVLFQVPLAGGAPHFMHVRGEPWDQFALDANETDFRALLVWNASCDLEERPLQVKYFSTRLAGLGNTGVPARAGDYAALPSPNVRSLENRFTDQMLVYGGRSGWGSSPPEEGEAPLTSRVVAVPLHEPQNATALELPHDAIRIERVGDNAVLTGYHDDKGLAISLLDLRGAPRLASTVTLPRRYESEGRSHAFNATAEADGSGVMGVPTVERIGEGDRWVWRSEASDVSFLSLAAGGDLASLGALEAREDAQHPSYKCEVSCVDWYGNTRPIFIDGRIFALSATEIVEGKIRRGTIHETRRVNLTAPIGGKRKKRR